MPPAVQFLSVAGAAGAARAGHVQPVMRRFRIRFAPYRRAAIGRCVTAGAIAAGAGVAVAEPPAAVQTRSVLADRVMKLTRESPWKAVAAVPIAFRTFHPQGMVKIGDTLFVSSVEVTRADQALPAAGRGLRPRRRRGRRPPVQDRHGGQPPRRPARSGEGTDLSSRRHRLSTARTSGCRSPSTGPTADRSSIASIPRRMKATEVFRFADHIGAHRPQHRRPHAARRQLGLAALLSLDARAATGGSRTPMRRPSGCARSTRRTTSITRTASTPAAAACCAPASPRSARRRTRRRSAGRDRPGRSRRRPAAAPGAGAAVDAPAAWT